MNMACVCSEFQDSKKVEESEKEMRESTAALPRLEQEVEEATAQLGEEVKEVGKMQEMANGESYQTCLPGVT